MGGASFLIGGGGERWGISFDGESQKKSWDGGGPPPTRGNPRLGGLRDTKFGTNLSNKKLLNAAKFQGYSFYRF